MAPVQGDDLERRGDERRGLVEIVDLRAERTVVSTGCDARAIADELASRQIGLSLGGSVCDPTDAAGRLLFDVLATAAAAESALIALRTRDGVKVAGATGRLR